jgi:hypothetical protein
MAFVGYKFNTLRNNGLMKKSNKQATYFQGLFMELLYHYVSNVPEEHIKEALDHVYGGVEVTLRFGL